MEPSQQEFQQPLRQWDDIQGVMRTQADRLDLTYLHNWADEIGVGDLLVKALAEAGLQPF